MSIAWYEAVLLASSSTTWTTRRANHSIHPSSTQLPTPTLHERPPLHPIQQIAPGWSLSSAFPNTEELIPLARYDSYGNFSIQSDTSPHTSFHIGCRNDDYATEKEAKGYACHVTCYNLLQQELNYTLKYADVLPLLVDNEYDLNKFSWSDYGGLAEYQEQFFLDAQLVRDGKLWMIEDPSQDEKNEERILQVWRPLVESGFKRPDERVGVGSTAPEIAELNTDESRA